MCHRYVANVIVGKLHPERAHPGYMIHSEHLQACNSTTIAKVFQNALQLLWPKGILYNDVLLLVTDGAGYMKKAAHSLSILYSSMLRITCVAHTLPLVAETIRSNFKKTDSLITLVKNVFRKSPKRVQKFKEKYPNIPLPPSPVCTRWGTWLRAAEYYADHLLAIEDVVKLFKDKNAVSIREAKALFQNHKSELISELATIREHYSFLAHSITKLEASGSKLFDSINELKNVTTKLSSVPDKNVKDRMIEVLQKNAGLHVLSAVVTKNAEKMKSYTQLKQRSPSFIASLAYAPIVSTDVERSFSAYKRILTDVRRFLFENLKMYVVLACFQPGDE